MMKTGKDANGNTVTIKSVAGGSFTCLEVHTPDGRRVSSDTRMSEWDQDRKFRKITGQ